LDIEPLNTNTEACVVVRRSLAGIVALNSKELIRVVGRIAPFHQTLAPAKKFVP
jgi:hypothetical protein